MQAFCHKKTGDYTFWTLFDVVPGDSFWIPDPWRKEVFRFEKSFRVRIINVRPK